jgi:segregation and condensation protein A
LSQEQPPAAALPASWSVQLPAFEGPLDLLLHLVRVNQVEIADIPVVQICDQFHAYLGLMEELNLDIAADYVYEAAQLIYLKSRLLLPRPPADEGETTEDPRQELVRRLLEYRRIKEAVHSLAEVHQLRQGMWTRPAQEGPAAGEEEVQLDLSEVSLYDLLEALQGVLRRYDREHPPPLVVSGEAFSVRDQLRRLLAVLARRRPQDLIADLASRSCRAEAVSAFLAVLELARLGLIRIYQSEGGDLLLHRTEREMEPHELETING